jgi:hypothetical protein
MMLVVVRAAKQTQLRADAAVLGDEHQRGGPDEQDLEHGRP